MDSRVNFWNNVSMAITIGSMIMNIWVEYFVANKSVLNNHAQMRENIKFVEPEPEFIYKRFCQSREAAITFAKSMEKRGYHTSIKTDGSHLV